MVFLVLELQSNLDNLEIFHVVEKNRKKYLLRYDQKNHLFCLN